MTVLLKQLDIHGFKSFASPTTFVFDRGIAAVIGPNGSGKSNVAEALRWVLGEQGYTNLRSRRTEDIIFAGSDKRAQMSMAEVVLTLDNADGDLPLPFSEITITRRAYRTGENQYLINGSRVRLKDVQQLVAPLGQSYTIIGQGLVDLALSQRPEERRGLFEHAAGISGLRLRANEAERSLAEAAANAQRLRDILSELEPRVRSLERSARLAREYGAVRDQINTLQRRYYARLWLDLRERIAAQRAGLRDADEAHQIRDLEHREAAQRLGALRGEERRVADELRRLTEDIAAHDRALADAKHRLALSEARRQAAATRLADMQTQIGELQREQTEASAEAERLTGEARAIEHALGRLEAQLTERDAELAAAREQRQEMQQRLAGIDRRLAEISRTIAESDGTRKVLQERRAALDTETEQLATSIARDRQRRDELQGAVRLLDVRLTELQEEISRGEADIAGQATLLESSRARAAELQARIGSMEREQAGLRNRLEVLERSHAGGEGLYAGVRAVVRAVHKGQLQLPGFVGTLAETIEAPKQYETAIEVALGGHLQDIIVERWSDAQTAIDFLKRANAGRATFQPIDTVRPGRRPSPDVRDPDCVGVAADLVRYPDRVASVVEQTLGRTLVVSDLDASRRILREAPGWTLVTLAGEIARPSGSVTGGGRTGEAGLLGRERERRALPGQIASMDRQLAELRDALEQEIQASHGLEAERRSRQSRLDERRLELREATAEMNRLTRDASSIEAAIGNLAQREQRLATRREEIDAAEAAAEASRSQAAAQEDPLRGEREQLAAWLASTTDSDDSAAALRSEIAAARERLRSTQSALTRAHDRVQSAADRITARTREMERMTTDSAGQDDERETLEAEIARLEQMIAAGRVALAPLEQQRAEVAASLQRAERALDRATETMRDAERDRDRATLNLARVQDEQVFLIERIRNDLGLDDPSDLEREIDAAGDAPDEREITRLRERLRRMSVVGEDVLEQYEAESQRLAYLTDQLRDVDEAADGLRKVLADLNERMTERFNETFRDVAAAFERTFTRLFGGGSARLVMNADDGSSGIDIVAQPPGKRLQNLNALSGGERALTAVALLIAIQRVNPSPFCLLDEVDAALDESNVIRFRDEIRDLSGATQFVVITHNRGTIEGADTLYGVTMGADSVSRVLSLKLDEAIRAVDEYETVHAADPSPR